MKYVEIRNFIKNNNLTVTQMYSEKQKTSRRVTYCILNNLTETQQNELKKFSENNNLQNFKITKSLWGFYNCLYLRFSV